jgi:NRPS condensation-like uncharacterized protein
MEDVFELHRIWFRLDNAAKIYPAIINPKDSCVFRVAVNLVKDVNPQILQQAVIDCKPRFPSFYVKLKRGLFWNYYEHNDRNPIVKPESPYVNQHIYPHLNNGYLFSLFYHKNRIGLEVFHGLCDGGAAVEFLKALVFRYFTLLGYPSDSEDTVLTVDQAPRGIEVEDSFVKNYTPDPYEKPVVKNAYRIQGTHFSSGIGVISGRMQLKQLMAQAKKYDATLTQYLAALLTYCIWRSDGGAKSSADPINICVPVNMRKYYSSLSLRNFSLYFYASTECANRELSFEGILKRVKETFRNEIDRDKLHQKLNSNVSIEKNIALRLCPLFIKNTAIRICCIVLGDKLNTCALSNFGNVKLPSWMSCVIKDFECNLGVGNVATHSLGFMSYNGKVTISFTRSIYETEIERLFFTYLADHGIDTEIKSNQWENCV